MLSWDWETTLWENHSAEVPRHIRTKHVVIPWSWWWNWTLVQWIIAGNATLLGNHSWPSPFEAGVGWLCCPGILWEPIRAMSSSQLIREDSATVISACSAIVDWSWPRKYNWCAWADLHLKAQAGYELSNIPPNPFMWGKPPPPSPQFRNTSRSSWPSNDDTKHWWNRSPDQKKKKKISWEATFEKVHLRGFPAHISMGVKLS